MDVSLLSTDDPRWPELLERVRHDVDHIPAYLKAHDEFRDVPTQLAVVSDDENILLLPLRIRTSRGGSLDASSSEVRSAPLFSGATTSQWRHDAIRALLGTLQNLGVTTLFLRFHPLLEGHFGDFARFGAVVEHGPTFNVPLDRPIDEIRAGMSKSHRRRLRQFQQAEYDYGPDHEWELLPEFHEIYELTMERVGAAPEFRFSREFFEQLRDELGDYVSLWSLTVEGRLAMGGIVTECNGIVQGLYGAVHPEYHGRIPQIGAYEQEIRWAHERGNHHYFFDGAATESLRQFKAGITDHRPAAVSARIVIDPVEYGRQCAQWEMATGRNVGRLDEYFPPYRRTDSVFASGTVAADEPPAGTGVTTQGESPSLTMAMAENGATIDAWTEAAARDEPSQLGKGNH